MDQTPLILLIDDDYNLCAVIERILNQNGFNTIIKNNSQDIESILKEQKIDLILLDMVLPGDKDGVSLCKLMRQLSTAPIIMLSGIKADVEKVLLLEVGADFYLTKPFNSRVLIAQIQACLRRQQLKTDNANQGEINSELVNIEHQIYEFLGWKLNITARILLSPENHIVKLTPAEFSLLQTLLKHPQCVLSRDQLLETIHANSESFDRSIDILISRLRAKIEIDKPMQTLIHTIRNAGYLLSCSVKKLTINSHTWKQLINDAEKI